MAAGGEIRWPSSRLALTVEEHRTRGQLKRRTWGVVLSSWLGGGYPSVLLLEEPPWGELQSEPAGGGQAVGVVTSSA